MDRNTGTSGKHALEWRSVEELGNIRDATDVVGTLCSVKAAASLRADDKAPVAIFGRTLLRVNCIINFVWRYRKMMIYSGNGNWSSQISSEVL